MYEAICISGGGCKAISLLGLLYEYHSRGQLMNINTWSVCSVGSFIAVLLLCGLNPLQILNFYPSKVMENISPSMDLLSTLITKAGIARIQKYTHKFCAAVEKFMEIKNPTLKQFYEKTGKTIYIEAVNVTKAEVIYFNHIDHPDIPLFQAVWASAAIPGMFIPIKIDGDSFIDGGFYSAVPLDRQKRICWRF
jgi:predicted acylesterase/phospholipase RssA